MSGYELEADLVEDCRKVAALAAAEAENERLRCCGNCDRYEHKPYSTAYSCTLYTAHTTPSSKCYALTLGVPSRWQRRPS